MTSFQISLSPKRRASGRFVARVRQALQKALAEEKVARGLTQSEVARMIEVHRSVVSRELRGRSDITLGRVGELAWALGREIKFDLVIPSLPDGTNHTTQITSPKIETYLSQAVPSAVPSTLGANVNKIVEFA